MNKAEYKDLTKLELPDDLIQRLQNMTQEEDEKKYELGNIAIELVDEFGGMYGKVRVRKRIAIEAGVSAALVRDREAIVRFFPKKVRDKYEVLTFSQFRAIKPAGVDKWEALADWAVESADDFGGRPAPCDAIRKKRLGRPRSDPTWERQFVKAYDLCEALIEDAATPKGIIEASEKFIEVCEEEYLDLTEPNND